MCATRGRSSENRCIHRRCKSMRITFALKRPRPVTVISDCCLSDRCWYSSMSREAAHGHSMAFRPLRPKSLGSSFSRTAAIGIPVAASDTPTLVNCAMPPFKIPVKSCGKRQRRKTTKGYIRHVRNACGWISRHSCFCSPNQSRRSTRYEVPPLSASSASQTAPAYRFRA